MTPEMLLSDVSDDVIELLAKDSAGKWRHLVNAEMVQQREFVEFQLGEPSQRLHVTSRLFDLFYPLDVLACYLIFVFSNLMTVLVPS